MDVVFKEEYIKKNIFLLPAPPKWSFAKWRLELLILDIIVSNSNIIQYYLVPHFHLILMIHTKSDNFIPDNMKQSCYLMSQFPVMKYEHIPEFTI